MTMKLTPIFALIFLSTAAFSPVGAQTYQWKDSSGRTIISDMPPPGSTKDSRTIGSKQATVQRDTGEKENKAKPADGPKTLAERDLDFKKRQQASREKAEKEAKDKEAADQKAENCERAKRNLSTLESGRAVSNSTGGVMDDSQRQQELEYTRRVVSESCK